MIHRTIESGDQIIEELTLPQRPDIAIHVTYAKNAQKPMPLLLGFFGVRDTKIFDLMKNTAPTTTTLLAEALPRYDIVQQTLLDKGCAIVALRHVQGPTPGWPKGKPEWVWPSADPAGAMAFALAAKNSPGDFGPVIDYIETRPELLRPDRIGYTGGSTTALIGYGLISKEPRITCAVLLAGSGALQQFVEGWARNFDWKSKGFETWPETLEVLKEHDPVLYVDKIFPRAVLMMNGGKDSIIPIESVRAYFEALYPYYADDPDRLQLIEFAGAGHGWDSKWRDFIVMDWFDRYLIQDTPPPAHPRPRPNPKSEVPDKK